MNYTRKRTILACDFCRHRKRRCDGQRPCSTCKDSNADCVYKDLILDKIEDASPNAVVDRLARIEALLEQQSQQLRYLSTPNSSTPISQLARFEYFPSSYYQQPASEFAQGGPMPTDWPHETPQFLIPQGHTTIASTLLSVPKVRDLLGEYPRDFFYSVEENLPLPDSLITSRESYTSWPRIPEETLNAFVESYFRHVHWYNPLFGRQTFNIWHTKFIEKAPLDDAETAICLCVYALGNLELQGADDEVDENELGLSLFKPALEIVLRHYTWMFKPNLAICQALLLAASYFLHLGRPLHCWRMGFFASQVFLHYVESRKRQTPDSECSNIELRVFWQCFLVDCNGAAELDVPRSGIEPLGDKMPLPQSLGSNDEADTMNFAAEIAVRRLLNRIHSSLYSPENSEPIPPGISSPNSNITWQGLSLQKLINLSAELDRQLEQWYSSMPDGMRPPRGVEPLATDWGRILRIRYYAAKHIIHRPFILHTVIQHQQASQSSPVIDSTSAASSSSTAYTSHGIPPVVLDNCETCIDTCVKYIYNSVEMLGKRTPYLWSFAQTSMACIIVLSIAEDCAPLRRFLPKMQPLRDMVVARLNKWAVKGSSFEAEVEILKNLVFNDHS